MIGLCGRRALDIEKFSKDMKREEFVLWRESLSTLL